MTLSKRFTIFSGHYGSGKTNIAVNYALILVKDKNERVTLYDLDIINPYFRTADSKDFLDSAGVKLISTEFANTNIEGHTLPTEVLSAFDNPGDREVFDIGGDDVGALALSRYNSWFNKVEYDFLLVVNQKRPLCATAQAAYENLLSIEKTSFMKFTGIVNNTNLGFETTPDIIINSIPYAEELALKTGLPIVFTSVRRDLVPETEKLIKNIFPLDIYIKPNWDIYKT